MNKAIALKQGNHYVFDEAAGNALVGGNKLRKARAIFEVKKPHYGVLTIGSKFSSHLVACAYWARYFGLPMIGIIVGDDIVSIGEYANLKFAANLGADLQQVAQKDAFDHIEDLKARYFSWLWIPGGGHTRHGADAYQALFQHLFEYDSLAEDIETVLVPLGTGTTALGVADGLALAGSKARVLGVSVSRNAQQCRDSILEFGARPGVSRIDVDARFSGNYENRTTATEAARWRFFEDTGFLVDPIYNAKALAVYYEEKMQSTLVFHTGGVLNNLL